MLDINRFLFVFLFCLMSNFVAIAQTNNPSPVIVNGAITVVNNGISLVPIFSIGKPAVIFDIGIKKNRFMFEPFLGFAVQEAKPWLFAFWTRYKLIQKEKFKCNVGLNPAFIFSTQNLTDAAGVTKEFVTTSRFFVLELSPNYYIAKNISFGLYATHGLGFSTTAKVVDYVGVNANFSHINLTNKIFLKAVPQIFYIKINSADGFFATSNFVFSKEGIPFSLTSIVNKKIKSEIASDDFVWNVGVKYSY